ncbi:tRNA (adenosine(37)-N6)-threonylcarbamoyltransferase complex transferase subunit TsaD [Candidatus Uhrbacteria bacterium CG_4_9_14_0_8_um_filter_41_16]|nr:MAG: tRNA (adenosine(37)-N6)-threonylcarbamoyltransferase complex transferase subunit TsaD [Candidatus Uhrbacteria bacterium CG_4_9_14_0_8_um_filter_41_16]
MIILGIDTSCDDTSVAILKIDPPPKIWWGRKLKILSNIVSSQVKLHAKYGGVYPFLAKREHQKNLPIVFEKALKRAKISVKEIDFIAVTVGPGLEPCLWVGVNFVKELAKKLRLPIIPINHIEAHIMANWLPIGQTQNSKTELPFMEAKVKKRTESSSPLKTQNLFPAICLVVSGGHSQLILMNDFLKYKILGETRDDAAGECLDKAARILGLPYPGGPAIAAEAANLKPKTYNLTPKLPRPMINQKNYDFSFSGLKTAVLYDFRDRPPKIRKSKEYIRAMSAEVQQAIIDVLISKTLRAAEEYKAKTIILGGGVASNEELREQFKEKIKKESPNIQYLIPNIQLCTDNAAMVGVAGYFHYLKGKKYNLEKIKANANLRIG